MSTGESASGVKTRMTVSLLSCLPDCSLASLLSCLTDCSLPACMPRYLPVDRRTSSSSTHQTRYDCDQSTYLKSSPVVARCINHASACLSVCLSICLSFCLPACVPACLSVCRPTSASACRFCFHTGNSMIVITSLPDLRCCSRYQSTC